MNDIIHDDPQAVRWPMRTALRWSLSVFCFNARKRLRRRPRWWYRLTGWLYDKRWAATAAVLNRIAAAELRHAALLLGVDFALGVGEEGFLGHLHEFSTGCDIGRMIRFGEGGDAEAGFEALNLERALYKIRREVTR